MAKDEEWRFSLVQASGKGSQILNLLPEIMPYFDAHILSAGEAGTIRNINDYKRRLVNWWRCVKFGSVADILQKQNLEIESNARPHWRRNAYPNQGKSNIERAMEAADQAAEITIQLLKQQRHA